MGYNNIKSLPETPASKAHGFMYMSTPAGVVIGGGDVDNFFKLGGATTAGMLSGFTHTDNRLTYIRSDTIDVFVIMHLTTETSGAPTVVDFAIAKGGVEQLPSVIDRKLANTGDHGASGTVWSTTLSTNEYLEVWFSSSVSGTITGDHMTCFVKEI